MLEATRARRRLRTRQIEQEGAAARLAQIRTERREALATRIIGLQMREPAVRDPRDAPHGRVGVAAHPDRDRTLHRQRVEAGAVDAVPASGVVDDLLREEEPQHFDLLLDPTRPVTELLAQRLVLDLVPAKPDAEA